MLIFTKLRIKDARFFSLYNTCTKSFIEMLQILNSIKDVEKTSIVTEYMYVKWTECICI